MQIQKLRLQRGWSQQQLADQSGLSVRTIQRIEAGQPASAETLKSIAAVFEIDFSTLNTESPAMSSTMSASQKAEQEAFDHVRKLRGFYLHLIQYLLVNAALLALNLLTAPRHLWSLWVIGGWGIGIASHAIRIFWRYPLFGPDWEKREVEKKLGRPL